MIYCQMKIKGADLIITMEDIGFSEGGNGLVDLRFS
jgi:hypothetical protein